MGFLNRIGFSSSKTTPAVDTPPPRLTPRRMPAGMTPQDEALWLNQLTPAKEMWRELRQAADNSPTAGLERALPGGPALAVNTHTLLQPMRSQDDPYQPRLHANHVGEGVVVMSTPRSDESKDWHRMRVLRGVTQVVRLATASEVPGLGGGVPDFGQPRRGAQDAGGAVGAARTWDVEVDNGRVLCPRSMLNLFEEMERHPRLEGELVAFQSPEGDDRGVVYAAGYRLWQAFRRAERAGRPFTAEHVNQTVEEVCMGLISTRGSGVLKAPEHVCSLMALGALLLARPTLSTPSVRPARPPRPTPRGQSPRSRSAQQPEPPVQPARPVPRPRSGRASPPAAPEYATVAPRAARRAVWTQPTTVPEAATSTPAIAASLTTSGQEAPAAPASPPVKRGVSFADSPRVRLFSSADPVVPEKPLAAARRLPDDASSVDIALWDKHRAAGMALHEALAAGPLSVAGRTHVPIKRASGLGRINPAVVLRRDEQLPASHPHQLNGAWAGPGTLLLERPGPADSLVWALACLRHNIAAAVDLSTPAERKAQPHAMRKGERKHDEGVARFDWRPGPEIQLPDMRGASIRAMKVSADLAGQRIARDMSHEPSVTLDIDAFTRPLELMQVSLEPAKAAPPSTLLGIARLMEMHRATGANEVIALQSPGGGERIAVVAAAERLHDRFQTGRLDASNVKAAIEEVWSDLCANYSIDLLRQPAHLISLLGLCDLMLAENKRTSRW